ncbi:MAG: SPOR domain-containing protein [Pseudomonadota bacterium]
MSDQRNPVDPTNEREEEDDPLAELARIVSSGTVFSESFNDQRALTDPAFAPPLEADVAKAAAPSEEIATPSDSEPSFERESGEVLSFDATGAAATETQAFEIETDAILEPASDAQEPRQDTDVDLFLGEQLEAELALQLASDTSQEAGEAGLNDNLDAVPPSVDPLPELPVLGATEAISLNTQDEPPLEFTEDEGRQAETSAEEGPDDTGPRLVGEPEFQDEEAVLRKIDVFDKEDIFDREDLLPAKSEELADEIDETDHVVLDLSPAHDGGAEDSAHSDAKASAEDDDDEFDPIGSFIQDEIAKAHNAVAAANDDEAIAAPPVVDPKATEASIASALDQALRMDALFDPLDDDPSDGKKTAGETPAQPKPPSNEEHEPLIDFGEFEAALSEPDDKVGNLERTGSSARADLSDTISVDGLPSDLPDDFSPDLGLEPEDSGQAGKAKTLFMAAAASLLLLAGVGAYFLFIPASDDGVVVVAASDDPAKVRPEDPGGKLIPNQDNPAYQTLNGDQNGSEASTLVEEERPPLLLNNDPPPGNPRIIGSPSPENGTTVSATRPPLGPRTVDTVVIRPDGTPVTSPTDTAASRTDQEIQRAAEAEARSILRNALPPVDSTRIAPLPESADEPAPIVVAAPETLPTADPADPPATTEPDSAPAIEANITPSTAPVPVPRANDNRTIQTAANTQSTPAEERTPLFSRPPPVPAARTQEPVAIPIEQAGPTGQDAPPPAETVTASAPAGFVPAPAGGGNFMVQLSARRTEDQARQSFSRLVSRHGFLSSYQPNIQRADLGERGIYHRLRVGPFSRNDANGLCQELKANGTDCILTRN